MANKNYYLSDMDVNASDVLPNHCVETSEAAVAIADQVNPGEYISLLNKTDLSEVLIYRRTDYKPDNPSIYKWDGKTFDISWFDKDKDIYYIQNADQLFGLCVLVEEGNNFKDKTIKLASDIKLDHHPWKPIGKKYTIETVENDEEYFRVHIPNKDCSFAGNFDGDNHVIYGLSLSENETEKDQPFGGLFRTLNGATISNLVLTDVKIGSKENEFSHSALFGYARKSKILNICVDGKIEGPNCSSIGGVAIDCSFIGCINRAPISGYVRNIGDPINIGGLVQFVGLSSDLISKVHSVEPKLFTKCLQAGEMNIDAKGAGSVSCGQLFGTTLYKKSGEPYGIQIDHCIAYDGGVPSVTNLDDSLTRTTFYGKVNGSDIPKNCISGIDTKLDLMSGLLGKTNIKIAVSVVRVTASTKIDAVVIPGSVNTLCSGEHMNSFITNDVSKLTAEDSISNLSPYYTFVKHSKI